jgi:hypothetical protein
VYLRKINGIVQKRFLKIIWIYTIFTAWAKFCNFFQTEDLSSLERTHCIYEAGRDRQGRPVIAFIGKWFPYETTDLVKNGSRCDAG